MLPCSAPLQPSEPSPLRQNSVHSVEPLGLLAVQTFLRLSPDEYTDYVFILDQGTHKEAARHAKDLHERMARVMEQMGMSLEDQYSRCVPLETAREPAARPSFLAPSVTHTREHGYIVRLCRLSQLYFATESAAEAVPWLHELLTRRWQTEGATITSSVKSE